MDNITDNYKFCLEDPEINMRKLYNCIGDILKRFKQLKLDDNNPKEVVVRNFAFGQPAGAD